MRSNAVIEAEFQDIANSVFPNEVGHDLTVFAVHVRDALNHCKNLLGADILAGFSIHLGIPW